MMRHAVSTMLIVGARACLQVAEGILHSWWEDLSTGVNV